MIEDTHAEQDEEFRPSARILMICNEENIESVCLLVHHALGRNWIPFSPEQGGDSAEAIDLAVSFAHSYSIKQIQIEWVHVTRREIFPDDFD